MTSPRALFFALLFSTLWIPSLAAAADDSAAPPEPYFYKGYNYGSQALYRPLWVFM